MYLTLNKLLTYLLSYNAFIDKYNIKTNYLEYFKVISALKQFKKSCSPVLHNSLSNDMAILLSRSNICKEFYRRLVQKKASTPLRSEEKWLSEGSIVQDSIINWKKKLIIYHSSVQEKQSLEYSSLSFFIDKLLQTTFFAR